MNDIDAGTVFSASHASTSPNSLANTEMIIESTLNCKLKMLELLDKMSIKNKTIVDECKLLDIVQRWSTSSYYSFVSSNESPTSLNSEQKNEDISLNDWIQNEILDKLVENSVVYSTTSLSSIAQKLKVKSTEMYDEWSNLKQSFKIPKKQRMEERIEHERELNNSPFSSSYEYFNQESNSLTKTYNNNNNEQRRMVNNQTWVFV
jgi:hypothetical protein